MALPATGVLHVAMVTSIPAASSSAHQPCIRRPSVWLELGPELSLLSLSIMRTSGHVKSPEARRFLPTNHGYSRAGRLPADPSLDKKERDGEREREERG